MCSCLLSCLLLGLQQLVVSETRLAHTTGSEELKYGIEGFMPHEGNPKTSQPIVSKGSS